MTKKLSTGAGRPQRCTSKSHNSQQLETTVVAPKRSRRTRRILGAGLALLADRGHLHPAAALEARLALGWARCAVVGQRGRLAAAQIVGCAVSKGIDGRCERAAALAIALTSATAKIASREFACERGRVEGRT